MANHVRFVRFTRGLADIIGIAPTPENEGARQAAIEALRRRILDATADCQYQDLRIIVKAQSDLWADGVRAGAILRNAGAFAAPDESEGDEAADEQADGPECIAAAGMFGHESEVYRAGKWGRYVRAPDVYFDIMRRFAERFVPLGEIASIGRGITSGCDAFFMPRDITATMLAAHHTDRSFRQHTGGAPRKDVESGQLRIIKAGDGSVHPIEAKYVAPEVHSLMKVDRPMVREADLDRVVLLVGEPMDRLKAKSPWVWRYLRYGMTAPFASRKSKPVPVPKRSTCAARDPWYDLTELVRPGIAFWPMAQQYRHIIAANPESLICNHNLFDVAAPNLSAGESESLVAVLNSTLVGLFKTFYGRFAGTEGNLKTEVVDVNLLEVPDPRGVSGLVAKRLAGALKHMGTRDVGRLVEEQLMDCHTPDRARKLAGGPLVYSRELQQADRRELDDAVFELLGILDRKERGELIRRLYDATAQHFRDIRVVEIEKMEQRAKSETGRFSVYDLAADVWDAAELGDATPLVKWTGQQAESDSVAIIPEERPAVVADSPLFSEYGVNFGKSRKTHVTCQSAGEAELLARLANLGVSGEVKTPSQREPCVALLDRVNVRMEKARARFRELAESRTGDEPVREQLLEVLERWFVLGRSGTTTGAVEKSDETDDTGPATGIPAERA